MLPLLLASCTGPRDDDVDSVVSWTVTPGDEVALTSPGGGLLQTHATVAWGGDGRYGVAFAIGQEPAARAVAQVFELDGAPVSELTALHPPETTGDKPDIAWDGERYVVAWTDLSGRVGLASVDAEGAASAGGALMDADARTDAVDLALQPDGTGIAIWTEFGAPGMGPTDGRIVWRAFTTSLAPSGPPRLADDASRKTSDAEPAPDGGWTAVWAIEYDHPTDLEGVYYEVWGRQHRADGTAWTFRADDLDSAYPSRPAIAVRPDGIFAVSWRDKLDAEGAGLGSGAYVRLFDADAAPLGPSIPVGEGGDGDRVVVGWAGDLAVVVWQETDGEGAPGVVLSAVDVTTQEIVVDRLWLSEPGGDRDERPSVAIREDGDGWDTLVVWEALGADRGLGLRARRVAIVRSVTAEPL